MDLLTKIAALEELLEELDNATAEDSENLDLWDDLLEARRLYERAISDLDRSRPPRTLEARNGQAGWRW